MVVIAVLSSKSYFLHLRIVLNEPHCQQVFGECRHGVQLFCLWLFFGGVNIGLALVYKAVTIGIQIWRIHWLKIRDISKKDIKSWENSQKLVILLRDYSMYIVAELWTDRVALASKWLVLNCCCVVVCMSWYALEKVIFRCVFCNKLRFIGVCEQG